MRYFHGPIHLSMLFQQILLWDFVLNRQFFVLNKTLSVWIFFTYTLLLTYFTENSSMSQVDGNGDGNRENGEWGILTSSIQFHCGLLLLS